MVPVAPEDLEDLEVEAGEDDVELEAGLEVLEEAGNSSQRTNAMRKELAGRYILPHSCF